jgi:hypothetical protein
MSQKMIIQEIEMLAWKALDLGQSILQALGIEGFFTMEKGILVTKRAVVRTTPADNKGVGDQI